MSNRTYLIPREIAESLGCNVSKVLGWINCGDLIASNISDSPNRPRWRISPDAFADFLESRSNHQPSEGEQSSGKVYIA